MKSFVSLTVKSRRFAGDEIVRSTHGEIFGQSPQMKSLCFAGGEIVRLRLTVQTSPAAGGFHPERISSPQAISPIQ
jgi:hypothetical protein